MQASCTVWVRSFGVLRAAAAVAACASLVGCGDLTSFGPDGSDSCSADFRTCAGADCYGQCLCEGQSAATCENTCGARPEVAVADLDEASWDADWIAFEQEVVERTNEARAEGGCCGAEGCFDPASPLVVDSRLRRAARSHTHDMATRDFFDHDNPDGRTPFDRIREAGWDGCAMGENIAEGYETPAAVVEGWLRSPGHCANLRSPLFEAIGVGFESSPGRVSGNTWTQAFGG